MKKTQHQKYLDDLQKRLFDAIVPERILLKKITFEEELRKKALAEEIEKKFAKLYCNLDEDE